MGIFFVGERKETNIWLKSDTMMGWNKTRNWWWLWEGIYNWSLAQWYASTEFCTMWIDFYICSVITNLIWIPWTRIASSALPCWTWRPPSSYFSFFPILKHTLVFQKSMWNIYDTSFPLEKGSARNTWKSKANKYWNMRKEGTEQAA